MRTTPRFIIGLVASLSLAATPLVAQAHATVTPNTALTASTQTFTVNVPNEKTVPTTKISVAIPAGVTDLSIFQKPGWEVTTESTNDSTTEAIVWSGGSIAPQLRDSFSFNAKLPAKPGAIQWKVYQTYSDGSMVSWDQPAASHDDDSETATNGPASTTTLTDQTDQAATTNRLEAAVQAARTSASQALYVAVAGLAAGLVAIFLATRVKK